ncbi:phage portal protein [Fusobacterium polymorphum]|uniref:phage portal protein n=1 Tax=Fusobacterium nucleatum subsp. polymorphum TaxID=76857 RepID=UPI0020468581|nr:MAG TPA: portal protein [Caudoviricetes sp.]DAW37014.1 MAG TPA: portal protein [Caudoviricetes sp.]
MNIFRKFFNKGEEKKQKTAINSMNFGEFFGINVSSDLSEVTYFTCLKVLSESVGKLSLHLKDNDNNRILNHEALQKLKFSPNPFMTPTPMMTLLEMWRNHHGNAYAYLSYDDRGHLVGIYPFHPQKVRIWIDNAKIFSGKEDLYYEYNKDGKIYLFKKDEILHLKGGLSKDGIVGMSVRETLATTLNGTKASQKYLNNLYDRGLTSKAILRYTGDLNKDLQKKMLEAIEEFISTENNPTGILPLPPGMDIVPLDLKLTDSQFFELKKYNALQIAAAFGVKPNHLNDYDKSSYSNSEMQNLTFYIDTLLYILTLYEEEFNLKLLTESERLKGLHFEFNVASILKGDLKTQAECITKYLQSGVYTINEARKKAGLPAIDGGDVIVMNGSYVPLEKLGIAYEKGGAKSE